MGEQIGRELQAWLGILSGCERRIEYVALTQEWGCLIQEIIGMVLERDAPCDESLRGWSVCAEKENPAMSVVAAAGKAICLAHPLRLAGKIGCVTAPFVLLVVDLLAVNHLPKRIKKRLWRLRTTQRDLAVDDEERHAVHPMPSR